MRLSLADVTPPLSMRAINRNFRKCGIFGDYPGALSICRRLWNTVTLASPVSPTGRFFVYPTCRSHSSE
jgi:hypothetical protein